MPSPSTLRTTLRSQFHSTPRPSLHPRPTCCPRMRCLTTLAIESSCDDTSVAVLTTADHDPPSKILSNTTSSTPYATLYHHVRHTADNRAHRGIHPLASLDSHEATLGSLVLDTIPQIPLDAQGRHRPDIVAVTRGPGMRASLNTGLNTAKGLALAWGVPLIGVHHMQAHALTPRLVAALQGPKEALPPFPCLTLLVSGGHTLLLHSKSLEAHPIIVSSVDIAIGDCLDKVARDVLPEDVLANAKDTSYGALLEGFAFPERHGLDSRYDYDYGYTPPLTKREERSARMTEWGWALSPPLSASTGGRKVSALEYSFTGLGSAVRRIVEGRAADGFQDVERQMLAREAMRVAFEHLAGRICLALEGMGQAAEEVRSLVVSGGVAANSFLRVVLRAFLDARNHQKIELAFPPPALCTDNAAMIAWAGAEMYAAGWESELSCRALTKWSLDPAAADGGILGVGGWKRRAGFEV